MVEFTGERVIPGQVNADLWSEHFARYAFARRFAGSKLVLDAGCGTGYGSAELAQSAAKVIGFDFAPDAAAYAKRTYPLANLQFASASCDTLPFPDARFDLVVAFEVIEHLNHYRRFIAETARVLKDDGILIVSTPNKSYYAESRALSGPNPYHEHEFEAAEFHHELSVAFPHVSLLLQNRVEAFAFHPAKTFWPAEARIDGGGGSIADAHFFIGLCSRSELPNLRSFAYIPKAANILREREQHVQLLEREVAQTNAWLDQTRQERDELLALYRNQKDELEQRNAWAAGLNSQLEHSAARVAALQEELAQEQAAAAEVAAGYANKVSQLEEDNRAKTEWALDTEARLTRELEARGAELVECVRLLEQAEITVEERTHWAQQSESRRAALAAQIDAARASRWLKLGKRLGLGPVLQEP